MSDCFMLDSKIVEITENDVFRAVDSALQQAFIIHNLMGKPVNYEWVLKHTVYNSGHLDIALLLYIQDTETQEVYLNWMPVYGYN